MPSRSDGGCAHSVRSEQLLLGFVPCRLVSQHRTRLTAKTGTIGFKPIYSFSFKASIGAHNASLIRKLVVHSNYPSLLTRRNLKNWIDNLGIDFDRLKVLAVSFETDPLVLDNPLPAHAIPHVLQMLPPVLQSNTTTNGALNAVAHQQTPAVTTATVTVTTTTTWQTTAPPVGSPPQPTQTWTQVGAASTSTTAVVPGLVLPGGNLVTATTTTPNAQAGGAGVTFTNANTVLHFAKKEDAEYELCACREKLWLKKATTKTVSDVVNTANTDLRAGDAWLIYRDPSVRRLPTAITWCR